jgi:hypothetical protein
MKKFALVTCALICTTGVALAADFSPPPAPPSPAPAAPAGFNWDGSYAGLYAGAYLGFGLQTGVSIGTNVVLGSSLLFGFEGQVGAIFLAPPTVFEADLNARLGFIAGADDRALFYGEGGIGFAGGAGFWTGGGGLEFGIGRSVSIFAEGKFAGTFGGGFNGILVQGGVNWHFGG